MLESRERQRPRGDLLLGSGRDGAQAKPDFKSDLLAAVQLIGQVDRAERSFGDALEQEVAAVDGVANKGVGPGLAVFRVRGQGNQPRVARGPGLLDALWLDD